MFWKNKKPVTETYSPFGIPGNYFIVRDFRLKIIIDPPKEYFSGRLKRDVKAFDKLLLIHGCETPDLNDIKKEVQANASSFTKILTFDKETANSFTHAEEFHFGSCWVLTDKTGNGTGLKKDYHPAFDLKSKFQVSFIKSNKTELPGHKLRQSVTPLLENKYDFDLFFPKERIETKIPLFKDAMFHITIENSQYENYITEKVIDCFMSYTIPIYWGCPNISEYFDEKGILTFNTKEELEDILANLNPEFYLERIEAIKNNYSIAKNNFAFFFDKINETISEL